MDAALKALAEPRRREILKLVWLHELPATAIADHFGDVSRPAISQHLGVLKAAGLMSERRDGTRGLEHTEVLRDRRPADIAEVIGDGGRRQLVQPHQLEDLASAGLREGFEGCVHTAEYKPKLT